MTDVQVVQDPLAVFGIVAFIGALAFLAVIFAFIGGRVPKPPAG